MTGEKVKGLVFDIQRYSIHDGPGIRTVVFLKGCPLKCKWCSNPESQSSAVQIMYSKTKCRLCGKCIAVCKNGALKAQGDKVKKDNTKCTLCKDCLNACYYGGWKSAGEWYTADELLTEVLKDETCFITSGGGITIGGGEPFYQHNFLKELLEKCQNRCLSTAIETCGYVRNEIFKKVVPYIDTLLMDIKHINDKKHIEWTGVSNRQILENWETAAKNAKHVICRVPVIPGFNDTEEEIKQIIDFAVSTGINEMHLLQYHRMGEGKYESLGLEYRLNGVLPPPDKRMETYLYFAQEKGIKTQIGG